MSLDLDEADHPWNDDFYIVFYMYYFYVLFIPRGAIWKWDKNSRNIFLPTMSRVTSVVVKVSFAYYVVSRRDISSSLRSWTVCLVCKLILVMNGFLVCVKWCLHKYLSLDTQRIWVSESFYERIIIFFLFDHGNGCKE